jgi:hypothetical protein
MKRKSRKTAVRCAYTFFVCCGWWGWMGLWSCQRSTQAPTPPPQAQQPLVPPTDLFQTPIDALRPTSAAQQFAQDIEQGELSALRSIVSETQLAGLDARTLYLAQQSYLAHHQQRFLEPWLQQHFTRFAWYKGTEKDATARLSAQEKANQKRITQHLDRALERAWVGLLSYQLIEDHRTYSFCQDRLYALSTKTGSPDGSCCAQTAYGQWTIQDGHLYLQQRQRCEGRGAGESQSPTPREGVCTPYQRCDNACSARPLRHLLLEKPYVLAQVLHKAPIQGALRLAHAPITPQTIEYCERARKTLGLPPQTNALSPVTQNAQPSRSSHLSSPPSTDPQIAPTDPRIAPTDPRIAPADPRETQVSPTPPPSVRDRGNQGSAVEPSTSPPAHPTQWSSDIITRPTAFFDGWWNGDHRYIMSFHAFGEPYQKIRWSRQCTFTREGKQRFTTHDKSKQMAGYGWYGRTTVAYSRPDEKGVCSFAVQIGMVRQEKRIHFPREDGDGQRNHIRFFSRWYKRTPKARQVAVVVHVQTRLPRRGYRWLKQCELRSAEFPNRPPYRYHERGRDRTDAQGWASRLILLTTHTDYDGLCSLSVITSELTRIYHHKFFLRGDMKD